MSLMRLLVAGRSLNTVKNQPSPYKMKQANLLPKFAPKKTEEQAVVEAPILAKAATVRELPNGGVVGGTVRKAAQSLALFKRCLAFRNPFRRLPTSKRIAVQTELLLENVRVVRNDLQDGARAAQPAGQAPRYHQSFAPKTSTVAGQWWVRLQMRLFAQRRRPG